MYFNERENTNIDKELKRSKGLKVKKPSKKGIIIICVTLGIILLCLLAIFLIRKITIYYLVLNGNTEITIYEGSIYNEQGFEAYDNKKNNLVDEVIIDNGLDPNTIGTYTITYTLHDKVRKRTINVVARPDIITVIHLNGDKNLYLNVGDTYTEPGYSAIDAIDGDLTTKVDVTGNVDTSRKGDYRIVYSVVNSEGITTTETRTVTVQ